MRETEIPSDRKNLIRIYNWDEIQTIYYQHHYYNGTVLYSEDTYDWHSVPMDSGKWSRDWVFALIEKPFKEKNN